MASLTKIPSLLKPKSKTTKGKATKAKLVSSPSSTERTERIGNVTKVLEALRAMRSKIIQESKILGRSVGLFGITAITGFIEALWGVAEFHHSPFMSVLAFGVSSIEEFVNSLIATLSSMNYNDNLVKSSSNKCSQLELIDSLILKFETIGLNANNYLSKEENTLLKNILTQNTSAIFVHKASHLANIGNAAIQLTAGLIVGFATLQKILIGTESEIYPSFQNSRFCKVASVMKEGFFNSLSFGNKIIKRYLEAGLLAVPMFMIGMTKGGLSSQIANPALKQIMKIQGFENKCCALEAALALSPEQSIQDKFPSISGPIPKRIKEMKINDLVGSGYGMFLTISYVWTALPILFSATKKFIQNFIQHGNPFYDDSQDTIQDKIKVKINNKKHLVGN